MVKAGCHCRRGRWSLDTSPPKTTASPCLSSNGLSTACKETRCVKRTGDGARTRDSLLGRQMVEESPPACHKMALGEHSYIFTVIHTQLRQIVAYILRQMVMDHMHWKEYTRHLLEWQGRQMVNHAGTKRCPSLSCSVAAFGNPSHPTAWRIASPARRISSFRTKSKALNQTVTFREVGSSCRSQVVPSHSTCASLGSETL